jgi:hypothetical protein
MYHSIVDPKLFLDSSVSFAEDGQSIITFSCLTSPLSHSLRSHTVDEPQVIDPSPQPESPRKRMASSILRGSVASGGVVSKGEDTAGSQEKVGLERMSIRKYNELVIPLAVTSVFEGLDSCDLDPGDLYGDGDY